MPNWRTGQVCCCDNYGDAVVEYIDRSSETALQEANAVEEAHSGGLVLWEKITHDDIHMARVEAENGRQITERAEAEAARKLKELEHQEERGRRARDIDKEWDDLFMAELEKGLRQSDSFEFSVTIKKRSATKSLGISLTRFPTVSYVVVTGVKAGPVQDWNEAHPALQVKTGDKIVEVNGMRGPLRLHACMHRLP